MIDKENVNKVFLWKEALKRYGDSDFLDMIRTYLGKINTPYNKDDLLNQLIYFFKQGKNLTSIKLLIDSVDAKILSIIELLGAPTKAEINRFLLSELSLYEATNRIANLKERMLIFKSQDHHTATYQINPILHDEIADIMCINNIISLTQCEKSPGIWLNSTLLATILSFVNFQPDVCKKDGTIKKKPGAVAEQIFHSSFEHENLREFSVTQCVERLILAMINLKLFSLSEFSVNANIPAWKNFAKLSLAQQAIFLCAALCAGENKNLCGFLSNAIFAFCDIYKNKGINVTDFRTAFEVAITTSKEEKKTSQKNRISNILGREIPVIIPEEINTDTVLDEMVFFGLVQISSDKKIIYVLPFTEEVTDDDIKAVNVESNLEISIFQGNSLEKLIPLMTVLSVISVDKLSYFKISKDTYLKSFDFGFTPEKIFALLSDNSNHPIPDSLKFFINDGYEEYKSCALYKGYVLHADKTKSIMIENSSGFSQIMKLAEGVFLIPENFYSENDREILKLCKMAGLDAVKSLRNEIPEIGFFNFFIQIPKEKRLEILPAPIAFSDEKITEYFKSMIALLSEKNFPGEMTTSFKERILQKLIISPQQLNYDNIKYEKILADGMDFSGKTRIIDEARTRCEKIEIRLVGETKSSIGIPVELHRKANDVSVCVEFKESHRKETFNVARISYVRRISSKIFSNFDLL